MPVAAGDGAFAVRVDAGDGSVAVRASGSCAAAALSLRSRCTLATRIETAPLAGTLVMYVAAADRIWSVSDGWSSCHASRRRGWAGCRPCRWALRCCRTCAAFSSHFRRANRDRAAGWNARDALCRRGWVGCRPCFWALRCRRTFAAFSSHSRRANRDRAVGWNARDVRCCRGQNLERLRRYAAGGWAEMPRTADVNAFAGEGGTGLLGIGQKV